MFSPESNQELIAAIDDYHELRRKGGDPSDSPHGPIGEWDVTRVTDMTRAFCRCYFFNDDISKWDVSRVTDMTRMFTYARRFNIDISGWDVSNVQVV